MQHGHCPNQLFPFDSEPGTNLKYTKSVSHVGCYGDRAKPVNYKYEFWWNFLLCVFSPQVEDPSTLIIIHARSLSSKESVMVSLRPFPVHSCLYSFKAPDFIGKLCLELASGKYLDETLKICQELTREISLIISLLFSWGKSYIRCPILCPCKKIVFLITK